MRVWVDLTNSPHVLVMRPLIAAMRATPAGSEMNVRTIGTMRAKKTVVSP